MVHRMDPLSALGALGTCLSIALAIDTKRNELLGRIAMGCATE